MTKRTLLTRALAVLLALSALPVATAEAQVLGAFRWRLEPFCNVLTLQVTRTGPAFTLDGFDDLCGAATRVSVAGTALQNPDGTIGIGLALILPPRAEPLQIVATINLATVSGTWRDNAGNDGDFLFNPASAPGQPRPASESVHWVNVNSNATVRTTSSALAGTVVLRPAGSPIGAYCIRFPPGAVGQRELAIGTLQQEFGGAGVAGFIHVTMTFGSVCNGVAGGSDVAVQTYNLVTTAGAPPGATTPANRPFMLMLPRQ